MVVLPEDLDKLAKDTETEYGETKALSQKTINKLRLRGYLSEPDPLLTPTRVHGIVQGLRGQAETLRLSGGFVEREKPDMTYVRGNKEPTEEPTGPI